MAGRKPVNVYVYDLDGVFICTFDSMVAFRAVYYPDDKFKRPLFVKRELGVHYELIRECGVIAYRERVFRDDTKFLIAIENSEYCKAEDNALKNKPIQVFNLKNELVAEFKTLRLATKMMPHISQATISRHLINSETKTYSYNPKRHTEVGLFFRYKKEE